jgi:presequence protease
MLKESVARMESSLLSSGHSYAGTRLSSSHTLSGAISEMTGGVSYLSTLKQLLHTAENDFPTLQVFFFSSKQM